MTVYNTDFLLNKVICGHALDEIRKLPSNSIDCAITSSPYYGLRSYNTVPQIWGGSPDCNHEWIYATRRGISGGTKSSKVRVKGSENFQIVPDTQFATCESCGAWLGELGQEPSPQMFIRNLTEIFKLGKIKSICGFDNKLFKITTKIF